MSNGYVILTIVQTFLTSLFKIINTYAVVF